MIPDFEEESAVVIKPKRGKLIKKIDEVKKSRKVN